MIIEAVIHSNSSKNQVILNDQGNILIYTTKPARNNQANKASVKALAKHLEVEKNRIWLLKGAKSKVKRFEVLDL